ncbi:nuclear transport factor 2 family protein [Fibrella sp. WM1]|uniref:nuclear transport factor 2 family protein n=1 Tax=Fibrella musci TaxID=3242485 RepID=UPI0035230FF6
MHTRLSLFFWLLFLGTLLPGLAQSPLHEQLRTLDQQRFRAQINKDSLTLSALLADSLLYTHSNGIAETKPQYIRGILSGKWDYRATEVESATVRLFGPTAILTGRVRMTVIIDGKPTPLYMAYTDVWHRTGKKRWQLVSWAASRLAN